MQAHQKFNLITLAKKKQSINPNAVANLKKIVQPSGASFVPLPALVAIEIAYKFRRLPPDNVTQTQTTMILRTTLRRQLPLIHRRPISTTFHRSTPQSQDPTAEYERPSPPRLPKHLQEEFEKLQKQAETAPTGNVSQDGQELHPDMRRPVQAEFAGDRNPVTGEVGGPKTEPTKHGDWSYGGRASDF